jgi:peptidoglycan-associated lipoprotein
MNSSKISHLIAAVLIVLLFAAMTACAKKPVAVVEQEEAVMVEEVSDAGAAAEGDVAPAEVDEGMGQAESLDTQIVADEAAEPLEGRSTPGLFHVYFDFDKSMIRADQVERLEKNAAFMKNNSELKVRIEGNCDERGTNEYNMALGQRRAQRGKQYLVNLGVAEARLATISYGEEQPINFGHDELSWSQNRRVDFVVNR